VATPTTALWLAIGLAKAKGVNPDQKLECSPIGSQVLFSTTFLAAIAVDLLPDVLVLPFLWTQSARQRRGL